MGAGGPQRASRRAELLALGLALVPFALCTWRFDWINDDAYITFSYARSLAEGHGFVHHPLAPPVEGFSELLFTLWMAAGLALGCAPEAFARASTIACATWLVAWVARVLAREVCVAPDTEQSSAALPRDGTRYGALAGASLALGCAAPLGVWATSGMGVAPFALAVFATYRWAQRMPDAPRRRDALRVALAASAAVLLRVDGAWWVAWLLAPPLVAAWRAQARGRARALLGAALGAATVWAALTAWRLATFGDWLPNTARAKLGFGARALGRGLDYVAHFALTLPGALILLACALAAAARCRDRRTRGALLGALSGVGAGVALAILVGGDFMAFGRFLVPTLPLLVVAAAMGLAAWEGPAPTPRRTGVVALCGVAAALTMALPGFGVEVTPTAWRAAHRFRFNPGNLGGEQPFLSELEQWRAMRLRAEEWSVTGRDLARLAPPNASFVAGAVGALGWFSRRRVFDRHGLLSPEVAALPPVSGLRSPGHDKFVGPEFFASQRPTYDEVGLWPESLLARHPYAGRAFVLGPSERAGFVLWVLPGPGFEEAHD